MSENEFWTGFNVVAALFILCVIGIVSSCVRYEDKLVAEMVSRGADPILAACSFSGMSNSSQCAARIAQVAPNAVDERTIIQDSMFEVNGSGPAVNVEVPEKEN